MTRGPSRRTQWDSNPQLLNTCVSRGAGSTTEPSPISLTAGISQGGVTYYRLCRGEWLQVFRLRQLGYQVLQVNIHLETKQELQWRGVDRECSEYAMATENMPQEYCKSEIISGRNVRRFPK